MDEILLKSYYKSAMQIVQSKMDIMNEAYAYKHGRKPIQMITSRLKTRQSVADKMRRHGYPLTQDAAVTLLHDIAGVRAICAFEDDTYRMAQLLLQHQDVTLVHQKDFIASPKASGYRSLHLIIRVPIYLPEGQRDVKVEVQFRTISMDFWASMEHGLRYKQTITFPEELNREILECAQLSEELDDRMGKLYNNLTEYIAQQSEDD